jgi:hypothetical protein
MVALLPFLRLPILSQSDLAVTVCWVAGSGGFTRVRRKLSKQQHPETHALRCASAHPGEPLELPPATMRCVAPRCSGCPQRVLVSLRGGSGVKCVLAAWCLEAIPRIGSSSAATEHSMNALQDPATRLCYQHPQPRGRRPVPPDRRRRGGCLASLTFLTGFVAGFIKTSVSIDGRFVVDELIRAVSKNRR